MGQSLALCQRQDATTKNVATTPRTVGSPPPEQKERTKVSLENGSALNSTVVAMTKTGGSSEFSGHHQCIERMRNQHIYDEVLTEVVPIVPFVGTIRVEEETSAALLDVIIKDTDEVTPNESIVASIELVLTAPEDHNLDIGIIQVEDEIAKELGVQVVTEVSPELNTGPTEAIKILADKTVVQEEEGKLSKEPVDLKAIKIKQYFSDPAFVTNRTDKYSIFDLCEVYYLREDILSTVAEEAEAQDAHQHKGFTLRNQSFPLELIQTAKFAVFDLKP